MLVAADRQTVEGTGLRDVLLDPVAELRVGLLPTGNPSGEILLGLGQVASVIEPPEFLQAVVACFPRHVVQSVAQEMQVATLPGGFGQDLHEASAQVLVVV